MGARHHQAMADRASRILAAVPDAVRRRVYQAGEIVSAQGERPGRVLFVEDGLCKLTCCMEAGKQALVGLRPPGWPIGSVYGLRGEEQPFAVEAACRTTAVEVAVPRLLACLETHPALASCLLSLHNAKLDQARRIHLLGLASLSARVRVEMLLAWLCRIRIGVRGVNESEPVTASLSQREMADLLAMTPETLTRTLKTLEGEAIIERRNGWITLLASDAAASRDRPEWPPASRWREPGRTG